MISEKDRLTPGRVGLEGVATSPETIIGFLVEMVFSFRILQSSEVCWKCRASARVIRTVEFSGLRGMELHNVYRCVRNPQHTFKKKARNID